MKQLTCEMCGSTDLMKQDGVFVCQTCGCKYSVEEAKKMMVEGTVSVSGAVQTDSSHLVQNYLDMAVNAFDAGNNEEAESYCNKIIEVEPTNYKAWMLKGAASAWQTTLANLRISEGINAFAKGVNYAPEDVKDAVVEQAKTQISNICIAVVKLQTERFAKWPDKEETNNLCSLLTVVLNSVVDFLSRTSVLVPLEEIMAPIATSLNQCVTQAYKNVIYPDYKSDRYPYPDDDDWKKYLDRLEYCIKIVKTAIDLCDSDDENDITRYENLIFLHKQAIESCSYLSVYADFDPNNLGYQFAQRAAQIYRDKGLIPDIENSRCYGKNLQLTDAAKKFRRKLISEYESKIKEIKENIARKKAEEKAERERIAREEAQKRYDAYWSEHADEKVALESEKQSLDVQIKSIYDDCNNQTSALDKEISEIPGKTEIANLEERITKLNAEKDSLGIFKGKQKKALKEEIDSLSTEKRNIQSRMSSAKSELEKKIRSIKADAQKKADPLKSRRAEIEKELCVERFSIVNVVDSNESVPASEFVFIVEDVFSITGRGTVATGIVESGQISLGESVKIYRQNGEVKTSRITGIEKFREKNLDTANQGDAVGLLLRGIQSVEVGKGDKIIK